jgi:radical SAM-linked protein
MQRLRITFSRGEELKYITHLDLMRLWQRVLRRADIPLVYSQGFSPHPRISLGAPLAIGVTSSSELMDIYLERRLSPHFFIKSVKEQLPRGIDILEVAEIGAGLPSLQSQIRFAEYKVVIEVDKKPKDVEAAIRSLLSSDSLPWQHVRDKEVRKYDLRALIEDIWLMESNSPEFVIGMRLRCDSAGTGRPEQVISALGFDNPPQSIHRTRLVLEKQVKSAAFR